MRRIHLFSFYQSQFRQFRRMSSEVAAEKQATASADALNYCTNIVRQYDYENFLSTLLLTKSIRSPAFVIRAFNVEIARIQDQTSDPKTAEFRLQFWKEIIQDIYKTDNNLQNIPANPIAQELFKICCCYCLQRRHLERLITSRSGLLKSKYFRSLDDVERYAEESVSSIYYLLLTVARVADVHADHAASHLGKAQGITNILRSIYVSNQHRIIMLPMDLLMTHKISQEDILRGNFGENMRSLVFDIAKRANTHLELARKIKAPDVAKQILLPAGAVDAYLTKLQKCDFNLLDKSLLRGSGSLPLRLYFNRFRNKF